MIVPELVPLDAGSETDGMVLSGGPSFGLVHLRLVFFEGASPEVRGAGRTNLAFAMLDRGTRRRGRLAFNEALEELGAELQWSVGATSTTVTLRSLGPQLPAAVELLAEALLECADDPVEFAVLRREVAEDIRCSLEEPSGVAARLLGRALWPDTAWGTPVDGTASTRRAVRRESLATRRGEVLSARLIAGIAADAPEAHMGVVRGLIAAIRREHPRRGGPEVLHPAPAWGATWACPFPDAEQAMVFVAAPAPAPDSADWYPVTLHHAAFTASMNSPLTRAVRGEEGLSYHVASVLTAERRWGMHFFSAQPQGSRVQYVLDRVARAWDSFGSSLPDEAALAEVVRHVSGTHRVGLETVRQRLAYAMRLVESGRPLQTMSELPERLAEVDRGSLERAHSLYGWSRATTVVAVLPGGAGDAQWRSERSVRPLGLETVV